MKLVSNKVLVDTTKELESPSILPGGDYSLSSTGITKES